MSRATSDARFEPIHAALRTHEPQARYSVQRILMAKTRVLLAEDHTVVAEGLQALLKDEFDLAGIVTMGGRSLRPPIRFVPT